MCSPQPARLALLALLALLAAPADARPRARSLGDNSTGTLEGGRSLPLKTPSLRVITRTVRRGFTFGTDELVAAIVDAAGAVRAAHPGAVLHVGNLSREGGGDIGPSRSHNSGRDADIAFYVIDAAGKPAHPDTLVALGKDGRSRDGRYRFDAPRSWALVKTLLADGRVELEWAFCAAWLRELLLEHARASGEDPAIVVRAETVLKQPGDSSPHDDHFHVRIYCAPEDRAAGCNGYGATWPWTAPADGALDARARELAAKAVASRGAARSRALDALVALRGRAGVPGVLPLLSDAGARGRVLSLIRATRAGEAAPALAAALAATKDPAAVDLADALAALGGDEAVAALAETLARTDAPAPLRAGAARALARMAPEATVAALPALAAAADGADHEVSAAATLALTRLTNRPAPSVDLAGARSGAAGAGTPSWTAWARANADAPRDAWVDEGFRAAGVPVEGRFSERVDALLRAVASKEPHVSWNAQRELSRMTGLDLGVRSDPGAAARAWADAWRSLRPFFAAP